MTTRRLLLLALLALPIAVGRAAVEQDEVFVSGRDGYRTFRIPAVIRAANGDLLAFCEGRKSGAGDAGDIDLLLKRSSDGGRTWPRQLVLHEGPAAYSNLIMLGDTSVGCLYERGEKSAREQISFARFTLDDLAPSR